MKRIIALLLSVLLAVSLCACDWFIVNAPNTDATDTTAATAPTIPTTEETNPTWHLQEVADKLAAYAVEFEWNDSVADVILTVGLPDLDMFDRVEQLSVVTYDIYLTDNTVYRVVLDAGNGDVQTIEDIGTNIKFYPV